MKKTSTPTLSKSISIPASLALAALLASISPAIADPLTVTITAQPIQTRAGSAIIASQPPTNYPRVLVTSGGSAVSGATVNVTVNQNSGNFTGNLSVVTDVSGNATFSDLVLTRASAGYTLTFTANLSGHTDGSDTSVQFPIIADTAANATLTTAPGNATYGSALDPAAVVTLTDIYGNPVSNTNIVASLNSGTFTATSNATVRTNTSGNATFSNLIIPQVGNYTVTFDPAGSTVPNVTSNVTVSPLATTLTIGNATMQAASSLPPDLVVTPAPSFSAVAFSQNASNILGSFSYNSSNTTAVGNHTLSITPGVGGTLSNYAITYYNGTLTVTAANATQMSEESAPVTTEAGRPIGGINLDSLADEPPTVVVEDTFGNRVPGITVNATLSTNPSGATLNGTTTAITGANGTAVFDNLIITKAAEGYKLSFASAGLTTIVSEEFNIEPSAAGNISVTTQPGNTTASNPIPGIGGNLAVQVADSYGNPVNNAYNVQATLLTGGFTGSSNTTVLTNSAGYGTFTALSTNQSGTNQIRFTALAAGNITATSANFTVDPDFSSANISVTTQPGNSTAGSAIAGPPTARILDQYGNAIPNYTVNSTISTNSGNFSGTLSLTTNATGHAAFGNLTQNVAQTGYTLTFSFSNSTSASNSTTTSSFAVDPAPASKLVMVTQPSSTAQAGIAITQQPAVRLQDAFSNNVTTSGTTINATASSSVTGSAGGNTSATTVNGTATFSGLTINGTIGNYTLTFNASGLNGTAAASAVQLSAGNPAQLSVATQPPATAMANATFSAQPVVQIRDTWNNFVATDNSTVVGAILNNGTLSGNLAGTANATAASGNATFSGLRITGQAGNYTLTFNATGLTSNNSTTINITADLTTANITMGTQPGNSTAGVAITGSPSVSILDQYNNPVGNYTVNATLNGGSSLTSNSTTSVQTASNGNATFSNLVTNSSRENNSLTFSFNPTTPTTASNSATSANFTVVAAAPDKLVMNTQPSPTAQAGIAITTQPSVRLLDQFNNNVLQNGTVVTVGIATGNLSSTLGGTTNATTDSSGTAQFAGLSINGTIGNYTLTFNATGLTAATSNSVQLTPGNATKLAVSTQPPATAMANATFSTNASARLQDAWSNNVTTSGITVNASLSANPGGNLTGTNSTTTNADGIATFTGQAIAGLVGNYSILFGSGSLSNATSSNITITPDLTSANITLPNGPGNTTAGLLIPGSISGNITANIQDQFTNPIQGFTVNASLNGASFVSNATQSVSTQTDGNATFSNLVSNVAGNFTISFSFANATSASNSTTSPSFIISPAAAAKLAMVSQPPATARAGVSFNDLNAPQARLMDQFNNNVLQNGTVVAIGIATGNSSSTLGGNATAQTDPSGVATFYGTSINGTIGNYTLTFNATGLTAATSNSVLITPGLPNRLSVAAQPTTAAANATFSPQPSVLVLDAWNNFVNTDNSTVVSATLTPGGPGGSLAGTANATANSGNATFGNLAITGQVGNYTLTFNATSNSTVLTGNASQNITITPDLTTANISVTTQPGNSAAGSAIVGPPTTRILDQYGNAIPNYTVNSTISTNSGNFSGTRSLTTNATGHAAFGNLTQTVARTGYTLTFSFSNSTSASNSTTTSSFAVDPAPASKLVMVTQPSSTAQAGIAITQQPAVRLQDAFSNNVTTSGTTINATASSSVTGSAGGNTSATTVNGTATFSGLTINGTIGNYTLTFSSGILSNATSNSVALSAGNAAQLAISTAPGNSTAAGTAFNPQPAVRLQDAFSNNVTTGIVSVTASASPAGATTGGNITALTSNSTGVATFSGLTINGTVGNYTLTFNATGLTPITSNVSVAANPATASISVSANATTSVAGQTIQGPPAARVVDGAGNALNGITVNTSINKNTGNFTGTTSATTNATGIATFGSLIQTVADSGYSLRFSFSQNGASGNATTANFTVGAASPANMTITSQPVSTIAGLVVPGTSGSPAVRLRDVFGNTVPTQNVTASLLTGNFALGSNTTAATDAGGNAIFSNLVVTAAADNYQIQFNGPNGTSVTSTSFNIAPGTVAKLLLTNNGSLQSTAQFGIALAPQPVIQLADAYDNAAALGNYTITAVASSGNVTSGTAVTNSNGTATFSGLALGGSLGNRTLTFSSAGLTNATSALINLRAGPPASLTVVVEPATSFNAGDTLRAGSYTLGSGPTVQVLDAAGNPVDSVSINATGSGFTAFGDNSVTTVSTNATGQALFSNLVVVKAGNGFQVGFASGNLSSSTRGFNVEALPASNMTITRQPPSTVQQGVIISPNPAVSLFDQYSNPATGNVSVSLNSGAFSGNSTTFANTVDGVATFTNLAIPSNGNYTLTFAVSGVAPATSSPFSVISIASGLNITGISAAGGGNYTISFTAQQGGNYWIQRTTNLNTGNWTISGNGSAISGNNTTTVPTPGGTRAFWRLSTQPPGGN